MGGDSPITAEAILRHFLHDLLSSVVIQWNKNGTLLLVIHQHHIYLENAYSCLCWCRKCLFSRFAIYFL